MTDNLDFFSAESSDSKAQAATNTGVPEKVRLKIAELRAQLNQWAHEYYVLDAALIFLGFNRLMAR